MILYFGGRDTWVQQALARCTLVLSTEPRYRGRNGCSWPCPAIYRAAAADEAMHTVGLMHDPHGQAGYGWYVAWDGWRGGKGLAYHLGRHGEHLLATYNIICLTNIDVSPILCRDDGPQAINSGVWFPFRLEGEGVKRMDATAHMSGKVRLCWMSGLSVEQRATVKAVRANLGRVAAIGPVDLQTFLSSMATT